MIFTKLKPVIFLYAASAMNFAYASDVSTTQSLPYESWLKILSNSLSGPAAFSIALIGIFSCGATLIFTGGEIGHFMRSFIYIILVMTMLIGANGLISNFFNGAVVSHSQKYEHTHRNINKNNYSKISDEVFNQDLNRFLGYRDSDTELC